MRPFVTVTPLVFLAKGLLRCALIAVVRALAAGVALWRTRFAEAGVAAEIPAAMMKVKRYRAVVVMQISDAKGRPRGVSTEMTVVPQTAVRCHQWEVVSNDTGMTRIPYPSHGTILGPSAVEERRQVRWSWALLKSH